MQFRLSKSLVVLSFAFQATLIAQNSTTVSPFENLVYQTSFTQTGKMDLDGANGDLSFSIIEASATRSRPMQILGGISVLPSLSYELTQLNFDSAVPLNNEDLHSTALQAIFIKNFEQSRWQAFGWTRAELASDYQGIASEDFTFDLAAGAGYQFNDQLMVGFGLVAINLNGDDAIFPGLTINWTPCDHFSLNLFGPNFTAKYVLSDNWHLTLTGQPGGGEWNIRDNLGQSRTLDLDSYLVGLNTNHRISGDLWFNAGLGFTVANEIAVRGNRGGAADYVRDLDGAPYAQVGLTLKSW